jgi:hypothetical protein
MPWDATELDQFAAALDKAAIEVAVSIEQVIAKGAVNIKKQLRTEMEASEHFRPAAHTIAYDITTPAPDTVVAEVGPTHGNDDPGSLANIAYFGTSRGGATVPDPDGALQAEGARTIAWFEKLMGGIL